MTDIAGYYDTSYPPSLWNGGTGGPPTGVVAGIPGHFTPSGSAVPASLGPLVALGPLGQTAKWAVGQYVKLGDNSNAHWSGTTWNAGMAPALQEDETEEEPESFKAIPVDRPDNLSEEDS